MSLSEAVSVLRLWYQMLEEYGVTVWYSAPTAFRMLMGAGNEVVKTL